MAFALLLAQRMGRTLEELGHTMSSEEFGLHLALENRRNSAPPSQSDADLAAWWGGA